MSKLIDLACYLANDTGASVQVFVTGGTFPLLGTAIRPKDEQALSWHLPQGFWVGVEHMDAGDIADIILQSPMLRCSRTPVYTNIELERIAAGGSAFRSDEERIEAQARSGVYCGGSRIVSQSDWDGPAELN